MNKKEIEEIAKAILKAVGKDFTGSIEFNVVSGRNEVKFSVKEFGTIKPDVV
jgi:hypothetical protein